MKTEYRYGLRKGNKTITRGKARTEAELLKKAKALEKHRLSNIRLPVYKRSVVYVESREVSPWTNLEQSSQ